MGDDEMLTSHKDSKINEIKEHSNLLSTDQTYPYESGTSWTVLSKNTAYKKVDKTLTKEISTGIPLELVRFFTSNDFDINQSINLKLNIHDTEHEVKLFRKNDGRHKLKLTNVKSTLELNNLKVGEDKLWFERDLDEDNQFYAYTKSIKTKLSVAPKPKPPCRNKPSRTSTSVTGTNRVGQDYFKEEVTEVCNGKCVVTGVDDQKPSILIGSHIKSWKDSNNEEKMDGHNGLLLAPHVDKLFDKYLISFSESGELLISNKLNSKVLEAWGINTKKTYVLTPQQQVYMKVHRKKFTFESNKIAK